MKKPTPPPIVSLPSSKKVGLILRLLNEKLIEATYKGEYLHWEELKHRPRPENLTDQEFWFAVKHARRNANFTSTPFKSINNQPFFFTMPNVMLPRLANIDRKSGSPIVNLNSHNQEKYLVDSLIEEAISSSQLEGAATTRAVAKEMLLSQRKPRTEDERMILNNYYAMQFIKDNKNKTLSIEFILEIHRILTKDLLETAGIIRTKDNVHVVDNYGEILHTPPEAKLLPKQLQILCDFANTDETEEKNYIHPVIKAIILHFMLAYCHPFDDGNGRTARALFYWFLLNRGYWIIEFISISNIIKKSHVQYGKAFLYTETDENDLTYFIFYQIKVILQAIDSIYGYIQKQTEELKEAENFLFGVKDINRRQAAIIQHALKNPDTKYSIMRHKKSNNITYETARTDLLKLEKLGLFIKQQIMKAFIFHPHPDLRSKIKKIPNLKSRIRKMEEEKN